MHLNRWSLAVFAAALLIFHALGVWLVADYYSDHIAHYDSVGTYIQAFQVVTIEQSEGYSAALQAAFAQPPLSITQSAFEGILSPILDLTPESIQLYNTLTLGVGMFGVMVFFCAARMPLAGVGLALALIFVPDLLYWWDLGVFDFRRDAGMYGLLTGALFLGAAYFTTPLPTLRARAIWGVAFGVVAGLTMISRDSAPIYLAGVVLAPLGLLWLYVLVARKAGPQLDRSAWALLGFAPFGLVFFMRLDAVLERVTNPMIMYGVDSAGEISLTNNLSRLSDALAGQFAYPFNTQPQLGLWVVLATCAALAALAIVAALRARASAPTETPPENGVRLVFIVAAGVWIPIFVHLFLSVIVRWGDNLGPIAGIAPYMPAMIGVTALFAGVMLVSHSAFTTRTGQVVALTLTAFVVAAMPMRALSRQPDYGPHSFGFHQSMASLTGADGNAARVAEMAQATESLRVPALQFIALQRGTPAPQRLTFTSEKFGLLDFAAANPPEEADRAAVLASMDRAIRCDADYILLDGNPAVYAQSNNPLLLFTHGRPLVEALLRDLEAQPSERIPQTETTFALLLDNRARAACPSQQ
jgi:hypothetical protein